MSLSLIVLRLEVADDTEKLPEFAFQVPQFELPLGEKKTYAEVLERPTPQKTDVSELQAHKGRREHQPLTIETFETEEVMMEDETEVDQAYAATGSHESHADSQNSRAGSQESEASSSHGASPRSTVSSDRQSSELSPLSDSKSTCAAKLDAVSTKSKRRSKGSTKTRDKAVAKFDEEGACSLSRPSSGKTKPKSSVDTVRFFSGNPAVENTEGIIHLYKQNQLTPLTEDVARSEMVCMLSVPSFMNTQDLLLFVAPVESWVENIKIIRDSTPNQYMVLIKFRSQKYSDEFYNNFNGITYNSLESDVCHLAYVAKLETMKASEGASLPVCGLTELPVCAVCLERMDESVDGVLTVLCNHSFHGSCLAQWEDTSCPVCRYMQTPEPVPDHKCFHCDSTYNLWICLICGHVGCGRYEGGHASSHFQETNHTYSMHLENNHVWDYAGDNFVHRLVQNKGDGKLVEVDEGGNIMDDNEKLDSITLEYTYLLTSQLEAQRHHFEEKIEQVEKAALARYEEMEVKSRKALETCTELSKQLVTTVKEKQSAEKKSTQLNTKMQKLVLSLAEEEQMNECLRENQGKWQARVDSMEKVLQEKQQQLDELQEQLRDVMFYLEAQQKLSHTTAATQEEIQEGQIVMQSSATGGATSTKRGRKKGGR